MAKPPAPEKEPKVSFLKLKVINDGCDRPYLIRFSIFEFFGFSLKLHFILRSDDDRSLHDHPWTFWTLMIAGGYWEETFPKKFGCACLEIRPESSDAWGLTNVNGNQVQIILRWYPPGSFRVCKSPHAHRLELEGAYEEFQIESYNQEDRFPQRRQIGFHPACTLVLMFPKTREWGFHTENGWLRWFDFSPNRNDCE